MPSNYFQTASKPLAATLVSLGFKLEASDRNCRRTKFCFAHSSELDEAVKAFWRRELKMEPVSLFINQTILEFYCPSE